MRRKPRYMGAIRKAERANAKETARNYAMLEAERVYWLMVHESRLKEPCRPLTVMGWTRQALTRLLMKTLD